jgi:hypothetical protein
MKTGKKGKALFCEVYMSVCQMLKEKPLSRVIKYVEVDDRQMMIRLEDCDINDKNVKAVLYSLYSMCNRVYGLSFSYNQFFRDDCTRQLIEVLPDMKNIRTLELSKI